MWDTGIERINIIIPLDALLFCGARVTHDFCVCPQHKLIVIAIIIIRFLHETRMSSESVQHTPTGAQSPSVISAWLYLFITYYVYRSAYKRAPLCVTAMSFGMFPDLLSTDVTNSPSKLYSLMISSSLHVQNSSSSRQAKRSLLSMYTFVARFASSSNGLTGGDAWAPFQFSSSVSLFTFCTDTSIYKTWKESICHF